MIELNVQDLRKKALIKFSLRPEGHVFAVRKVTPGDELALSELARKRNKMIVKASELQAESMKSVDSDDATKDRLTTDINKLITELTKLEKDELAISARIFDDGGDGSLSVALYNELSEDERTAIISAVLSGVSIGAENGEAS